MTNKRIIVIEYANKPGDVRAIYDRAREVGLLHHHRSPHYTTTTLGLLRELDLAAGGTLFFDDAMAYSDSIEEVLSRWSTMKKRPVLLFIIERDTARTEKGRADADYQRRRLRHKKQQVFESEQELLTLLKRAESGDVTLNGT
jgi:hypothetical protein